MTSARYEYLVAILGREMADVLRHAAEGDLKPWLELRKRKRKELNYG